MDIALIKENELIKLEEKVWDALISGDKNADSKILADDFLGVYESGFEDKKDHIGQLSTGPTIENYVLSEFKMRDLCADTVLLSYKAHYSRKNNKTGSMQEIMYVSSIWQNREGSWLNIFSQDTISKG